jgi:hypothetical protein
VNGYEFVPGLVDSAAVGDSMGLRRFATLQGIQGFILFLTVAAGPFIHGRVLAMVAVLGALFTFTCERYQPEQGAELIAPLASGR